LIACYHHVQQPCRLKDRFGLIELAPVLERRAEIGGLLGASRRSRGQAPELEPGHYLVHAGDDTPFEHTVEPEELVRRFEAVFRHRRRCRECPANRHPLAILSDHGLGCVGRLPLPIPAGAEESLLGVVESIMDRAAELDQGVTLPVRFIWDNGIQGDEVAAQRAAGGVFESPESAQRRVGPFLAKRPLNSDQFLALVLQPGELRRPYLHLFAPFFLEFASLARQSEDDELAALAPLTRLADAVCSASDLDVGMQLIYLQRPSLARPGSHDSLETSAVGGSGRSRSGSLLPVSAGKNASD